MGPEISFMQAIGVYKRRGKPRSEEWCQYVCSQCSLSDEGLSLFTALPINIYRSLRGKCILLGL